LPETGTSPRPAARVTAVDVARFAGVSQTTVSHVLTGGRPVAESTRVRVLDAISTLGYRPNQLARALRSQTTKDIAFVVPNVANVAYPISIRGAAAVLRPTGHAITVYDSDDHVPTQALIHQIADRMPTGVVFLGLRPSARERETLDALRVPYVIGGVAVGAGSEGADRADVVFTDQEAAVRAVTGRLAAAVDGPVVFLGGDAHDEGADARERGYRAGMADAGREVAVADVALVPYSLDGGRDGMQRLLADGIRPAVVVAGSDMIGIGALLVARENGIDVPGELRIVGFDNIESTTVTVPTLSSIETHLADQGAQCAELLLERIAETYTGAPRVREVATTLVQRASTGVLAG
jgi:LacI family transcriptional regulator